MSAQHPPARDSRGHFVPLSAVPLHLDPDTWDDTCTHTTKRNPVTDLPHDPYITAVVDALTAAGLEPDAAWTSDAETDPYGDGCTTMLSAILRWNGDHNAIADAVAPDGMLLLWEHSADEWQSAEVQPNGSNAEPDFLGVAKLADPADVVTAVRELLAGRKVPSLPMVPWGRAAATENAINAWADSAA